jgi:hypothetical protein
MRLLSLRQEGAGRGTPPRPGWRPGHHFTMTGWMGLGTRQSDAMHHLHHAVPVLISALVAVILFGLVATLG